MKTLAPLRLLLALIGLLALGQVANAACVSPAGDAGDQRFASNYGVMAFCDGTNWVSMAGGVSVTVNTSGGGATPAGASADVQFNSSGALAADTGNFTYSSGLLKAPNISTTAFTASGLGTFGSALVNGGMTVTGQASITTISSSLIQLGDNGASCTSGLAGGVRFNSTSNTIDYCSGTAWLSLGPSATVVPSFSAYANATQSIPNNTQTKLTTLGSVLFDTNSNYASNRFTVTVPGTYLFTAGARFPSFASGNPYVFIEKNGSTQLAVNQTVGGANTQSVNTSLVDKAVAGDYYEVWVQQTSGGALTLPNNGAFTYFTGSLISMSGGGSGGAVQSDRITSGTVSIIANQTGGYTSLTTNGTTWGYLGSAHSYIPTLETTWEQNGTISTSMVQFGSNSASCDGGMAGSVRYSATSDTIQVCTSGGWTSVASSSTPNTTISQGTANYGAIFSGPNTLVTDSAFYVDRTNHYIGIGTSNPQASLHVNGSAMFSGLLANNTTTGDNFINMSGTTNTNEWLRFRRGGSTPSGSAGTVYSNFATSHYFVENALGNFTIAYSDEATDTPSRSLAIERFKINPLGNVIIGSSTSLYSSLTVVNGEVQTGTSGKACTSSQNGGAIRYASGNLYYCNGSNTWTALGGGGGSPAGSTGDIQFNDGGAFAADTGKLYWDKTNHRLGIGMTPSYELDVSGSGATTRVGIGRNSYGDAAVEIGSGALGSHNSYIDLTGDTTYPDYGLRILRGADGSSQIAQRGTGNLYIQTIDQAPIVFRISSTNQAIIDTSGNVGIGTLTPAQRLDVNGFINATGGLTVSNSRYTDFWSTAGQWLSTPYGVFGTNGSYESTWSWNGYRNASSGWTALNVGGYTQNAMLGLGANGFSFYASSTAPGSINPPLRMRLTPDGNLGIGNASPSDRLTVGVSSSANDEAIHVISAKDAALILEADADNATESDNAYIKLVEDGGAVPAIMGLTGDPAMDPEGVSLTDAMANTLMLSNRFGTGAVQLATNGAVRMTVRETGNVGIGTIYPSTSLTVSGTTWSNGEFQSVSANAFRAAAGNYGLIIRNDGAATYFLLTASGDPYGSWNTLRPLTINDSTGSVSMGTALSVTGNVTAAAFLYSSDKRLKSDITNLTGGLSKLDTLNPVSFRFTADPSKTTHLGLIAQDVRKVYPEAVHTDDKGYLKLDYPALVGPIFEMLKELKTLVMGDHGEIAKLRAANDNLRHELKAEHDARVSETSVLKAANDNLEARQKALEGAMRAHGW